MTIDFVSEAPLGGPDPQQAVHVVELPGRHRVPAPVSVAFASTEASSTALPRGAVAGVPLPSAALLFPVCFGIAIYAARRMRRRRLDDRRKSDRNKRRG